MDGIVQLSSVTPAHNVNVLQTKRQCLDLPIITAYWHEIVQQYNQ